MKRTVAFSPQEGPDEKTMTAKGQDENMTTPDTKNKTAIVASLPVDRSRPINPYSSLTLSPKGHHALVAGKDTIQLVSVGPNGLGLLKSLKIAHHFTAASSSSSPGSNETRNQQQGYGDVRDAFQQQASAVTAGVTNMNLNQQYGNIIVTKVAWSNDYYCPPRPNHLQQHQHSQRNSSGMGDTGMDDSLPIINTEMEEGGKQQQRRRRKQNQRGEKETNTDNDHVDNNSNDDIETMAEDESLVAAAGSNGVVLVWRAKRLLFSDYGKTNATNTKNKSGNRFNIAGVGQGKLSSSSAAHLAKQQRTQQPEGILSEHTRAVNGLAWHPTRSGLLLTASQDATVKLWERRAIKHSQSDEQKDRDLQEQEQQQQQKSWFSMVGGVVGSGSRNSGRGNSAADDDDEEENKYTWRCKATFSVGDAVRDIRWNKLIPDVFGVVTASGNLVVYNMHVSIKALVKIAAHTGDASSLDFHPQRPFIVATGGSADRCVKIWDLESSLKFIVNTNTNRNIHHHYQNNHENSNSTWTSTKSNVSNDSANSSESQ